MIAYPIGTSGQVLVLADRVLKHVSKFRQRRWYQRETGGQLFARFGGSQIVIEEATGPRATDRRTRASYIPDRTTEQIEIDGQRANGLHYIGDWHTHPEPHPYPSPRDTASIAECVAKSTHELNGFVLLIVGRTEAPLGLHVSIHDGITCYPLTPSSVEPVRRR